jgi:hypothetical protein
VGVVKACLEVHFFIAPALNGVKKVGVVKAFVEALFRWPGAKGRKKSGICALMMGAE